MNTLIMLATLALPLENAGTNRTEIIRAYETAPNRPAMAYLIEGMPGRDLQTLSADYLLTNLALAEEARRTAPWASTLTDEIYLEAILPYSSIHEEPDAWRPHFRQLFAPLVKNCTSTTEAAELLNREIWRILGVTYSPQRDKPDQSPFHSIRIHKASCSGLSILLIDACRAVGIPARFAGCVWRHKPGNHSWVEIWDRGQWHHLGAEDAPKIDQAWFNTDTAHALENDPRHAIYASAWHPTGLTFYSSWNPSAKIPAHNVTARYLALNSAGPIPRLSIDLRDANDQRIALPILLLNPDTSTILARGTTHDNSFDLNNHLNFSFPAGTRITIALDNEAQTPLATFTFANADKTLTLKVANSHEAP